MQYVTSDCDAIQNVYMPHGYACTPEQAVADTLLAGADLNCGTYYQQHLPVAYAQGLFNETVLDQALIRLYSALVKLGYFDPATATPYRSLSWSDVSTPSSEALALRAAEEGIVLLKNDGTLPLALPTNKTTTIGVIGAWANATTQMQGNYFGIAPYLHSPLYAVSQLPHVNVTYSSSPGGQSNPTTGGWPTAFAAASTADILLIAEGIDTSIEAEGMDRYNLDWLGNQIDLITELAALGKPTILLQMGDQLDDTPFLSNPNISAILWAGYPGQSGGDALVNIITGKTAPAGRLPVTQYPASYAEQVAMTDMSLRPNATSGNPGRTYKWFDNATLPFGYGLHYTTFSASIFANTSTTAPDTANNATQQTFDIAALLSSCNTTTSSKYLDLCPFLTIPVDITNTGTLSSDYVTLAFLTGTFGPQPYPLKSLVAYQRLFDIVPASTQTAMLNLTLGSLARHDEEGNQILYPGEYELVVDVPSKASWNFTLTGGQMTLDAWPARPTVG